jgi:hypothetical protein
MNEKMQALNKAYQIINLLEYKIQDKYNMPEIMKRLPWEDPSIIEYYVELGAEVQDFLAYVNSTANNYGWAIQLRMSCLNGEIELRRVDGDERFSISELDCVVAL